MQGAVTEPLMALGGWKSPAMLNRYAHLSPTHLYQAVEDLTQFTTVTKSVINDIPKEYGAHKSLQEVLRRSVPGLKKLEP